MDNPFAGKWRGDWYGIKQGYRGSWELTIDQRGEVHGKSYDSSVKMIAELMGRIENKNVFMYEYKFGRTNYSGKALLTFRSDDSMEVEWHDFREGVEVETGVDVLTRA